MAQDALETILLRFRDLSTSEGATISFHRNIVATKEYVWWGWWSKRGEKVPYETFTLLNERAYEEGVAVYLFDSGRQKFYEAKLFEIKFSNRPSERVASPEKEATPEYYRDTSYLAWFKFGAIEDTNEDSVLNSYSYLSVPEFFTEDYGAPFNPYDSKVVVSTRELRSQDRTVWFLRQTHSDDDRAEVLLTKAPTFDNFLQTIKQASGAVVLMSDLHFPHAGDPFPLAFRDNAYPLKEVVSALTAKLEHDVAALVLAGDVTTRGDVKGFDQGVELVEHFKSVHNLRETDFLTVPGNHDFGYSDALMEEGQVVEDTSPENAAAYTAFYQRVMGRGPEAHFACGFQIPT